MAMRALQVVVPIALLVAAGAGLAWWGRAESPLDLFMRVPGTDRAGQPTAAMERPPLVGTWTPGEGSPSPIAGEWPQFRGAGRNGIARSEEGLLRTWPDAGPTVLWQIDVGEGHAGPAVSAGRVYLYDYDREAQRDVLRCLSLDDGRDIWRYSYPVKVKRNHGMSRTVPAVADGFVVGIGPKCQAMCLDAQTGEERWLIDMVAEYGTTVPPWYAGQCPLIDEGRVILAPAGPEALVIARDCATGRELWRTPNPRGWAMTHSSLMPMILDGRKTYIYCGSGGVAGIDAATGELLWDTTEWKISIANVPSPVVVDEDRIFLSGGYNAGAAMLQIVHDGEKYIAAELWRVSAKQFGAAQQTPVLHEGRLYGTRPDGQFACLDLDGNVLWTSGPAHRFGIAPFTFAGNGLAYILNDEAHLTLADITTGKWTPLAEATVWADGHDAWGPMALAGGRLILRDLKRMVCLQVAE